MYISFFQNLVHTFFLVSIVFSNIFFVFFILGFDHIYFYKNMMKFSPMINFEKDFFMIEKGNYIFIQNMPYES